VSTVFISYRQSSDAQRQRVRDFASRLRASGVDVLLDQFLLDSHPAGPDEGWDNWSSDRARQTEYVLIVGTKDWFECFDKTQPRGTGLGAAWEADDLRDRIYQANGINASIRVVLFDDAEDAHIPGKLRRYHRFHADRDFASMVRWLGGRVPGAPPSTASTPHTKTPHNLPALQPFFGRKDELEKIAEALDPESRTWGAIIDGPGGMGKTSLAVRAAYDASPEDFERIVFVSLKARELDDDGVRDMSGFLISGLAEMFNELAREFDRPDIAKEPEEKRPRLLLEALRDRRMLLVLDNLESLTKAERDTVFTLVKRLPQGCKAILTSRVRIGSAAEELILEQLSEAAALETLAKLAESNPGLARTSEAERLTLYRVTGGKPLLLRWTAGQIGRGSCVTFTDALFHLESCPKGNDPLEFVFGDLVEDFTQAETAVLCALTYFTLPAKVDHIVVIADCVREEAEIALRSLVNRSLVVPSDELKTFVLVPLVASFLRKKRPEVVADAGGRLEQRAYGLLIDNGFDRLDRFGTLEAAWPTVAAALPAFRAGPVDRLQVVCNGLRKFLEFTGRWDEALALSLDGERRALAANRFEDAGWRANDAGWIHSLREQATEVLSAADRAGSHWRAGGLGTREEAIAIRLRGLGHQHLKDLPAAIADFARVVDLLRSQGPASVDVAIGLCALAGAETDQGDLDDAEKHYLEALAIAEASHYSEGVASYLTNLAAVANRRQAWPAAEGLAREALPVSETVGRKDLIAWTCLELSVALLKQGKKDEARAYHERCFALYTTLGSPRLRNAIDRLRECGVEEVELPPAGTRAGRL
jgi:tetratricopeptide (TPR) repeat protein